jgi:hypothetical protein
MIIFKIHNDDDYDDDGGGGGGGDSHLCSYHFASPLANVG